jgi:hypothetical protein
MQCARFLERLPPEIPFLTSVAYADEREAVLCASGLATGSKADHSYFQEALASSDPVVGEFIVGKVSKLQILPVAMTLAERGEAPRGVLVATLHQVTTVRRHRSSRRTGLVGKRWGPP